MMRTSRRLAMRRFAISVVLLGCAPIGADDPKLSVSVALIELKMDLEKESAALRTAVGKTTDKSAQRQRWNEFYARTAPICEKTLRLAEENPVDPSSHDALAWIVTGPFGYTDKCGPLID